MKQGGELRLYLDGQACGSTPAPALISTAAENFAIGGNPNYAGGPELLAAKLADLKFFARALSAEEVKKLHEAGAGK